MEEKKTFSYEPYIGGAGPEQEQIDNNNQFIVQELNKLGIKGEWIKLDFDDGPIDSYQIKNKKGETLTVDYGRWGYIISDDEEELCLPITIQYIKDFMEEEGGSK